MVETTTARAASAICARDRRFFFVMAVAIAATVVAGFGLKFAAGRIHHRLALVGACPWPDLHGLARAVSRAELAGLARRSRPAPAPGKIAAAYVGWMVLVGLSVNTLAAITHRVPSFFELNVFPIMDSMTVSLFAGLT